MIRFPVFGIFRFHYVLVLAPLAGVAFGSEAGFTPDNKLVIQIEPEEERTLLEIDPKSGACRRLFEPLKDKLLAVTLDRKDRWLLATGEAIWTWKPGEPAPAKIADAPVANEGWEVTIENLAADPSSDRLLVTCAETKDDEEQRTPAWIYDTAAGKWGKVRCRYVPGIETPCFNARGELCFSVRGDLWHGVIEADVPWTLVAYRYAAVATLYTYNGSPSQEGTEQLATAGGELVVNHSRMGGSGWGSVIAIPGPSLHLDGEWGAPELKEQLTTAGKLAANIQELGDGGGRVLMGNSRDGSRAWVMWRSDKQGLLYAGGKKSPVPLKLP
jgi:hypothetical protein